MIFVACLRVNDDGYGRCDLHLFGSVSDASSGGEYIICCRGSWPACRWYWQTVSQLNTVDRILPAALPGEGQRCIVTGGDGPNWKTYEYPLVNHFILCLFRHLLVLAAFLCVHNNPFYVTLFLTTHK